METTDADRTDPDVALILASYEAFARGDIEAAVLPLHDSVEWIEPDEFPNGGRREGPRAVAEYLRASYAMWSELNSAPTPYRRGEDIVIVHHAYGRLADGTPHDATVADVYTIRDGRVVRMQAYANPNEALSGVSE
jgi:ketosteroid isomerase-like protein